jgi:leucyl aminopeptidase (aminopeptidase T)
MTDSSLEATNGARTIIKDCLDLTRGSNLLLLADETALSVIDPFFSAARDFGVRLTTLFYSREQQLTLDELGPLAANALQQAEAAVLAHTADDACSRFRTKLVSEWRSGTRLATMPGATARVLAIASRSDYELMARRCESLTPPLLNGRLVTLTTYDSEDRPYVLTFALGGVDRIPVHSTGLLRENAWGNVPSGEIFTAPLENSANGDFLVNGAVGQFVVGAEDVVITFKAGQMVSHRFVGLTAPLPYLRELEEVSRRRGDGNWNVIAEFGIGVNDGIEAVTGIPLIDEKIFGTVHIGLGNNVGWQGNNKAQLHLDMITKAPDVAIDGKEVLRRGAHVVVAANFDDLATFTPSAKFHWPADAIGAKLDALRFERAASDHFYLNLQSTQSGRVTRFPLANARTSRAARRLTQLTRTEVVSLSAIELRPDITSPEELKNLLSMLWSYGALSPLGSKGQGQEDE